MEFEEARKQVMEGRHAEAEPHLERIVAERPDDVEPLHALAVVKSALERLEEARELLERAQDMAPTSADIVRNLAVVNARLGDSDKARDTLRTLVARAPGFAPAYLSLADMEFEAEPCRRLGEQAERAIAEHDFPEALRSQVHYAAGRAFDRAGLYDRAFPHFQAGAALKRAKFNPAQWRQLADRVKAAWRALGPEARVPARGDAPARPVYIVGLPRSGSTLIEQALLSHPEGFGGGERKDISRIATLAGEAAGGKVRYPEALGKLGPDGLATLRRRYWEECVGPPEGGLFVDKQLQNFVHIGLIALIDPDAVIVEARRHPLDWALSAYSTDFAIGEEFSYAPAGIGHMYRLCRNMMSFWAAESGLEVLEVWQHQIVEDFEGVVTQILERAGQSWDPSCARFHEEKRAVSTASYQQVRQPLNRAGVGRWRNYAEHMEPFRAAIWPL